MSAALPTMFSSRCPECSEGKLFKGVLEMNERCEHCGAVFNRDPGSWTGPTVLTYVGGSVFAVILILVLWTAGILMEPGTEWIVSGSVGAFVLLTLRPVKALWVGMLHDWGYVYADAPDDEAEAAE